MTDPTDATPTMDGFEFVTEVRKHEAWRAVPIVVISAKDLTPEERVRLNGYVEKILQKGSYNREELLREVHVRIVASARSREARARGLGFPPHPHLPPRRGEGAEASGAWLDGGTWRV